MSVKPFAAAEKFNDIGHRFELHIKLADGAEELIEFGGEASQELKDKLQGWWWTTCGTVIEICGNTCNLIGREWDHSISDVLEEFDLLQRIEKPEAAS